MLRQEIESFFAIYKDLEPGRFATVHVWGSREDAAREIDEAPARFEADTAD